MEKTLNVRVTECGDSLEDYPDARIVETVLEYHGRAFKIFTVADVRNSSIIRIELEGRSLSEVVPILQLQFEKLERTEILDGLFDDFVHKRRVLFPVIGAVLICLASFGGYEITRHVPLNADTYLACEQFRREFKTPVPEASVASASRKVIALGLKSNDSDIVSASQLLSDGNVISGMMGFVYACKKIDVHH